LGETALDEIAQIIHLSISRVGHLSISRVGRVWWKH
jgi:hypothetical protein